MSVFWFKVIYKSSSVFNNARSWWMMLFQSLKQSGRIENRDSIDMHNERWRLCYVTDDVGGWHRYNRYRMYNSNICNLSIFLERVKFSRILQWVLEKLVNCNLNFFQFYVRFKLYLKFIIKISNSNLSYYTKIILSC